MNRKPLGRGLDALFRSTVREQVNGGSELGIVLDQAPEAERREEGAGAGLRLIAREKLVAGRFQPRRYFDDKALGELAEAIRSQGIIEPLIARPAGDGYELIAGERRLRAATLAGLTEVPVIVRELDDRAALEMSLVENLLRENLNVIEEGEAFARLNREFEVTHEAIANRIGKSRSYVTNMIRLIDLPREIIEMIGRGELNGGQVRPLLALDSPEAQLAEARRIARARLSSREAEEIANESGRKREGQGRRKLRREDPNLLALAESIQRALKRKVRIVRGSRRTPGRVELEFYNDDDLTALARTLAAASRPTVSASHV
jgi:ParB family chromosome partitioning protein